VKTHQGDKITEKKSEIEQYENLDIGGGARVREKERKWNK